MKQRMQELRHEARQGQQERKAAKGERAESRVFTLVSRWRWREGRCSKRVGEEREEDGQGTRKTTLNHSLPPRPYPHHSRKHFLGEGRGGRFIIGRSAIDGCVE